MKQVDRLIREGRQRAGRRFATMLVQQVERLDRKFGPSQARAPRDFQIKRNRYRISAGLLAALGYSQREIAETLFISQAAVCRLLQKTAHRG